MRLAKFQDVAVPVRVGADLGRDRKLALCGRPFADGGTQIVTCSEPSPDYATAFSQDIDLTVKSTAPQAPGEGTFSNDVAEKIEKLEGRSKGVLALRDGLYAACQAYTNGQIGKDA